MRQLPLLAKEARVKRKRNSGLCVKRANLLRLSSSVVLGESLSRGRRPLHVLAPDASSIGLCQRSLCVAVRPRPSLRSHVRARRSLCRAPALSVSGSASGSVRHASAPIGGPPIRPTCFAGPQLRSARHHPRSLFPGENPKSYCLGDKHQPQPKTIRARTRARTRTNNNELQPRITYHNNTTKLEPKEEEQEARRAGTRRRNN